MAQASHCGRLGVREAFVDLDTRRARPNLQATSRHSPSAEKQSGCRISMSAMGARPMTHRGRRSPRHPHDRLVRDRRCAYSRPGNDSHAAVFFENEIAPVLRPGAQATGVGLYSTSRDVGAKVEYRRRGAFGLRKKVEWEHGGDQAPLSLGRGGTGGAAPFWGVSPPLLSSSSRRAAARFIASASFLQ